MLSNTLQAVVCQVLFKRIDQPGMVPGVEILICTPAVRNLIRENRIYEIHNVIETVRAMGMQTMDTSIKQLYLQRQNQQGRCDRHGRTTPEKLRAATWWPE